MSSGWIFLSPPSRQFVEEFLVQHLTWFLTSYAEEKEEDQLETHYYLGPWIWSCFKHSNIATEEINYNDDNHKGDDDDFAQKDDDDDDFAQRMMMMTNIEVHLRKM